MTDIIKLLPDSVANQIAAGEVIQRPASAVKELMENAIDAGATQIDLVLRDAGKSLIQVIDNGCGMSETDARMSFERHATSKIRKADDLFAIRTMGFRGEALASIAAIAQMEMKSRRTTDELGTHIIIEGSVVQDQQLVSCKEGTVIVVKNLFFNVPARRNFLKSNQAEMRHIFDEFYRISLVNADIGFTLTHNEKELYHLYPGNLKQRIVALFGHAYNQRLLPVDQQTEAVSVSGFIGKPEFARKTRGEQYFFVNNRFIKHPYLHHAVANAFQELLPKDSFPSYFLHLHVDPAAIDINIHPTKTEVNFQETQLIYAILHAAVKKSIGQHNLSPMLDFSNDQAIDIDFGEISKSNREMKQPGVAINPDYNPFEQQRAKSDWQNKPRQQPQGDWRILYEDKNNAPENKNDLPIDQTGLSRTKDDGKAPGTAKFMQLHQQYIVTVVKSGLMIIDQHLAHWRILYEKFMKQLASTTFDSQQELFPQPIQLNAVDAEILIELKEDLALIGFSIEESGQHSFVIHGTPAGFPGNDPAALLERVLENYKHNLQDLHLDKKLNLARSMSVNLAIRVGKQLSELEMATMVDSLFACQVAEVAPDGRKIIVLLPIQDLQTFFK
jgi:DNA mismatch repair protein MutL